MASKSDIRAGGAFVEIWASMTKLDAGLKAAERKLQAFGQTVTQISARLAGFGVGILGSLTAIGSAFASSGSDLLAMSQRTGVAVESLSELRDALGQNRIELGTFESAISAINGNVRDAISGNADLAMAFARVGLNAAALSRMGAEERFNAVAEAVARIPGPANRAAAAMQHLGGTALLPALSQGVQGLNALRQAAIAAGRVMSKDEAKAAQGLTQAFNTMYASLRRVIEISGAALAPNLTKAFNLVSGLLGGVGRFIQMNPGLVTMSLAIGGIAIALGAVGIAIGLVSAGLGTVLGLVMAIATPVGLVSLGIGAIVAALGVGAWYSRSFSGFLTEAMQGLMGIVDALTQGDWAEAWSIAADIMEISLHRSKAYMKEMISEIQTDLANLMMTVGASMAHAIIDASEALARWHAQNVRGNSVMEGVFRGAFAGVAGGQGNRYAAAIEGQAGRSQGERDKTFARIRARMAENEQAMRGQLGQMNNERQRQIAAELQGRIAALQGRLGERTPGGPRTKQRPGLVDPKIPDPITRTRTALTAMGTFDAFSVGQIAGNRVEQMTLDINRRMEEHMRNLLAEVPAITAGELLDNP